MTTETQAIPGVLTAEPISAIVSGKSKRNARKEDNLRRLGNLQKALNALASIGCVLDEMTCTESKADWFDKPCQNGMHSAVAVLAECAYEEFISIDYDERLP